MSNVRLFRTLYLMSARATNSAQNIVIVMHSTKVRSDVFLINT